MAKILIIDDEIDARDLLARLLTKNGYEVVAAADGKEGVAMFEVEPVDLVITDIVMPEKDGIETITDLRRNNPDLKIIAMSGGDRRPADVSRNYLHSAKLIGANRSLQKPFDNADMLGAVRELLS